MTRRDGNWDDKRMRVSFRHALRRRVRAEAVGFCDAVLSRTSELLMTLHHRLRAVRIALALTALGTATTASSAQQPVSGPVFRNGMAQLVPAFQDSSSWIRQDLWVETDFDTDHDGKHDRVHVDVTRPRQTETDGLKLAVLYGSSPYFAGTARGQVNWNVEQELGATPVQRGKMNNPPYNAARTRISTALVNEWVPRGFAVVHSEASGTGRSQGCPTVGDYPERAPMKFVVDWLNRRLPA